jgi:hypothetical protein
MKGRHLLCLLAQCAAQPGCAFMRYSVRNLFQAPAAHWDHVKERDHLRCEANEVWKKLEGQPEPHSKDYALGFKAGYTDYIWAGGLGEPPALPPWRYRGTHFQSPEGHLAVEDWFAGFRHGAGVAHASGRRQDTLVTVALPPRGSYGPPPPQPRPLLKTPEFEEAPPPRMAPVNGPAPRLPSPVP